MKKLLGVLLVSVLFAPSVFAHCGSCGVGDEAAVEKSKKASCGRECACDKNKADKAKAESDSVESVEEKTE